MFKMKFQKAKVGGLPAFELAMPAPEIVLAAVAQDAEKAAWVVDRVLRNVNNSVKLVEFSGDVLSTEDVLNIIAQGMAVSNSNTWTADDFQAEWAAGLNELTAAAANVADDKLALVKELLAKAVRHGGKTQLSALQCSNIVKLFADCTNDHEVFATAVTNAKWKQAEDKKADDALGFLEL